MKRRWISIVLALVLVVGIVPVTSVSASAENDAQKIVDYVNNQVGMAWESGGCQAYVWAVFYGCYGVTNTQTICCATKAW